ncbi:5591_t:CDS:10 [Entrophospora sp. SA101]|nr:5591_t:CDS:10 [Entrophospora sp. SA101]
MESTGFQLTDFVRRPNLGKEGRQLKIRANFFEVLALPEANIHHYDVTITPDVPPALNRRVFQTFEEMQRGASLGGVKPVFDGRKNMYTARPLPFGDAATFDVTLPEDDGVTTSKRPPRSFKVKIKKVAEINMEELHRFLNGKAQVSPNVLTGIMALDVLIRYRPSLQHATVGRSFYTPSGSQQLYGGVEVWQGFYQSARPTPKKMMINIDVSATAFYESGNLVQVVVKILGRRSADDLRKGISDKERTRLEKALKNLKVRVVHRGDAVSQRRFRISKLTPTPANSTKFDANGRSIDVATYFQDTYKRRLQYPFLPCVVVRKENYLPMEVCEIIPGQRYMRKLNERQTADMIKFTCQPPHIRANKIKNGLDILDFRNNEYLKQFNLQISTDMTTAPARVLPTPTIMYHQSSREASFTPRDGSWNLRDKKVATGAVLGSWGVIAFGNEREMPPQTVQHFVRELITTCQDTGMNIPNKDPPILHRSPHNDIEESVKQGWIRAGNKAKSQPQLLVCILPNTGVPLYAEIKRISDTVIGVSTQCVQAKHMMQAKKQYCANVCLKMNVKLGGMNSYILPTQIPFISQRPTILMGADVTHPPPGTTGRSSIAALCASMDAKASRYAASIRVQQGRQEMISDLANMVKELLKTFYQTCGKKPDRILFYRDGVSEGQFEQVLEFEVKAIKAACKSLDEKYKPTVTFVVVQKRHHARFFPMDKKESDRSGNCLPGTVVESVITHPFQFDFYLLSHSGLQGTSRPTHYHVLYDENRFTPDSLQSLSYNLCYVFARCTRSVSLVPPVYYAHLVCSRARFHSRGVDWSDTEASEESTASASQHGTVKAELQKKDPWSPENYTRHANFVPKLSEHDLVTTLLSPQPHERILDVGCGDGVLTFRIQEQCEQCIGIDQSEKMISAARVINRCKDVRVVDAERHLSEWIDEQGFNGYFDAVFSNADVEDSLIAALDRRGFDGRKSSPWYFPTKEDYVQLLNRHSFTIKYSTIFQRPTELPTNLAGWIETFGFKFFEGLYNNINQPEGLSQIEIEIERIKREVEEECRKESYDEKTNKWILNYVRLRFVAIADNSDSLDNDDNLYPIAVLLDELRADDVNVRLNAIRRLSTIALALGDQRTREELIPFLDESIDDEDEVLLALAEELGNFIDYVGGKEYAHLILRPLENLATVEETLVREKAVESLNSVAVVLSQKQIEDFYIPLIKRLSGGDWFTSRTSACGLYAAAYKNATPNTQNELRDLFRQLTQDETPMVRRAAATNLGMPKEQIISDIIPLFNKLAQDEQDSVRLLTVEDLVDIAGLLTKEESKIYLLQLLRNMSSDKSWRVRYMIAENFVKIAKAVGEEITQDDLVMAFVNLLKDNEAEFVDKQIILSRIIPCVKDLVTDTSQHVRASLATQVSGLAPVLGKESYVGHLLPLFLQLLKDEFPEVRLNIISKLEQVNEVIGIELLSQNLLPAIVELAEDKQWRVRLAIIDYIPLLASQLGVDFFNEKLGNLCMSWLGDNVYSIREAATVNLKKLTEVFGVDWAKNTIIPQVLEFGNNSNYLYRMTTIFAITTMAPAVTPEVIRDHILPTVNNLVSDPIPNIRFNVAKSYEVLIPVLKQNPETGLLLETQVKPALDRLKEDSDSDVKYFAEKALLTITGK